MSRVFVFTLWLSVMYGHQGNTMNDFVGVLTGNDNLTVYVNGQYCGQNGGYWSVAKWFSFPHQTRVVAVVVNNIPGGYGAFLGVFSNGVVSDDMWRCSETGQLDQEWATVSFDDTSWSRAVTWQNNSGALEVEGIPTNVHWIGVRNRIADKFICRRRFNETGGNISLVSIFSDALSSKITLYQDGKFLAQGISSLTILVEVQRDLLLAVSVQDDYYDDVLFKASTSGGVITDARWKCTDRHYQGWYLPEFNDSGWNAAYVHKENYPIDALPLEAQWIGNPAYPADQIYCRRAVSLDQVASTGVFEPSTRSSHFLRSGRTWMNDPSVILSSSRTPLFSLGVATRATVFADISATSSASSLTTAPTTAYISNATKPVQTGVERGSLSTFSLVLLAVGFAVVTLVIGTVLAYNARKKHRGNKKHSPSTETDQWETKADNVTVGEELGHGAFGKVFKGVLKVPNGRKEGVYSKHKRSKDAAMIVAVKMLEENATADQKSDFLDEINLMKAVGFHNNIVSLIGCCTISSPCFLIVEFASNGDLLSYLRQYRKKVKTTRAPLYDDARLSNPAYASTIVRSNENTCIGTINVAFSKTNSTIDISTSQTIEANQTIEEVEETITTDDMMSYSWQIAQGMEYLSHKDIVHRDLAARNVLVCDNKAVKVADFGLARSMQEENVYHVTGQHKKLPLKWMAPEAIYYGVFTTKSDVWSFGVLLWEIATLGGFPYPGIRNHDIIKRLKRGYRMEKPDMCSEEFYQLMMWCWTEEPENRPTFTELRAELEAWMQRDVPYLDMDRVDDSKHYYDEPALCETSESSSDGLDSEVRGNKAAVEITRIDIAETNENGK